MRRFEFSAKNDASFTTPDDGKPSPREETEHIRDNTMNPYMPYSPEWRVWNLAQLPGVKVSDALVLQAAKWVPHDGTALRTDLLLQYDNDYSRAH